MVPWGHYNLSFEKEKEKGHYNLQLEYRQMWNDLEINKICANLIVLKLKDVSTRSHVYKYDT